MVTQVVLLAGGKGTRMRELTETIPKPMVEIGDMPCLEHLMNIFNYFGKFEFLVSTGYKSEIIESYFQNYKNVKVINTGIDTMTGGRVHKLSQELDDNFIVTYGDGLANVNIEKLINHHNNHNGLASITVTNPISRFGLVEFEKNNLVKEFIEKPLLKGVNINIGFFVFNREVLNYLDEDCTLETEPLINLAKDEQLYAFKHDGYFEPMDTYREYLEINKYWASGNPPWLDFN
jgi:glucose-1-phosphate cytidylyltransferase|tara:strand:+ start:15 stop:713 length:699 start_codon:yes stop_codon:yes gene_type:complete